MADLVAAGLARPAAIAVDLTRHFEWVRSVLLDEEVDALLARPALGVQAGIDDQPTAAEGDRLKVAQAADREVVVHAKLVNQLFGVERPAFGISVEGEQGPDERLLVRIFALPDVARDRFVRGEVRKAVLAVQVGRAEIDPELARNLAVDRTRAAIGRRRSGLLLGRHALHFEVAGHHRVERTRQLSPDECDPLLDIGLDLVAALFALAELEARILRQRLHALADGALSV